ncbi:uncharacterized protein LOC117339234 isoform X2 [Pecten maximus]|uniref:uncharacterized protein LOC117339234 isoform X2 n=1 Tax=Pecten maximus TaxID=6579 RepID=UPI001458CCE4|nr:uncharacterized protein LOC117339234 isoform X2 [Pecten maximus]
MITVDQVEHLTVEDFQHLGVISMGIRIRISQACRNYLKAQKGDISPCIKKFMDIQNRRKVRRKSPKKDVKTKLTRRLYVGWKHEVRQGIYKLVSASKGGGQQVLDLHRDTSKAELMREVLTLFFPGGQSLAQNVTSDEVNYHLASFSGAPIPDMDGEGGFTVGKYVSHIKTSPIRIYLHTQKKTDDLSDLDLPSLSRTRPSQSNSRESTSSELQQDAEHFESSAKEETTEGNEFLIIPPLPDIKSDSSSDFEDSGTPTVSFNRRPGRTTRLIDSENLCNSQSEQLPTVYGLSPTSTCSTTMPLSSTDIQRVSHSSTSAATSTFIGTELEKEMELAMETSLGTPTDLTMEGILSWWKKQSLVLVENPCEIVIMRSDLLKSALRVMRRESFNFCEPFKVTYSGEDGDDLGGPRREFLRGLMAEICGKIFQGQEGQKFFRHDLEKLSQGFYELAGKLVAFSLLHGGPGIPVLHPAVANVVLDGEVAMETETLPLLEDCIFDWETREKLILLQNTLDEKQYHNQLDTISDWCLEQSLSISNFRHFEKKQQLMDILKKNEIFYRVQSEFVQFRNGLNKVGRLLDAVQLAPKSFLQLFTQTSKALRFRDIRELYKGDPQGFH